VKRQIISKKQSIMWTALPHGLNTRLAHTKKLRVTVYVSPQLTASGNPTLALFPDFLHWPQTVQGLQFKVQFGSHTVSATRVSDDPDPDLWSALFPPTTTVQAYAFQDPTSKSIVSYPASTVLADIKSRHLDLVKAITATPSQFAGIKTFNHIYGEIHVNATARKTLSTALAGTLKAHHAVPPAGNAKLLKKLKASPAVINQLHSPAGAHFQLQTFYHRSLSSQISTSPKPLPTPGELKTMYDFHSMVSVLGHYPQLLLKLGLAVELEIDSDPAIPSGANASTVRILPSQFSDQPNTRPYTFYQLDSLGFRAAPNPYGNYGLGSDIEDGLLKLNDSTRFEVAQVDIDGTALKIQSAVNSTTVATPGPGAPTDTSLPAMRTGGLSLLHIGHATSLAATLEMAAQQHLAASGNQPVYLYADDLVRGYAVDILDESTNTWRSLCLRDGTYQFLRAPAGKQQLHMADEGFVTMTTTQDPNGSPDDIYLHEQMFRWTGWSLAAPRPMDPLDTAGNAFDPTDPNSQPAPATDPDYPTNPVNDPNTTQFGFAVSFEAQPGSLPRLRFGRTYQARARVVDLAGNRVGMGDAAALLPAVKSPATPYQRWEPIVAPALNPRKSLNGSPGESITRLVVRSDAGKTVEQYFSAQSSPAFNQYAERHFLPPKTSQAMAESHGMFDVPPPPGKEWYDIIVAKDVSLPLDPNPPHFPIPNDVDTLPLPYLPDPLAAGATLVGLPGGQIVQIPFTGPWPEFATFRLIMKGIPDGQTPAAPAWDAANRLLTIQITQGDTITGRYSCYFPPGALDLLGSWSWVRDAGVTKFVLPKNLTLQHLSGKSVAGLVETRPFDGEEALLNAGFTQPPANLWKQVPGKPWLVHVEPQKSWESVANQSWQTAALLGAAWMFTPYREVTLVHAVQHPLIKPKFTDRLHAQRDPGSTHAVLIDIPMPISGKSTIELDLEAQWYEPIDDPTQLLPAVQSGAAHVSKIPIQPTDTALHFPSGATPYTSDTDKRFWHVFNDTKYRRVAYTGIATTRYREYFPFTDDQLAADPTLITSSSDTGALDQPDAEHPHLPPVPTAGHPMPLGVIDVPSSARPPAPSVLYVVPTFERRSVALPTGGIAAERLGGGLRVYLERPWYASGDGELLGVVLPAQTTQIRKPIRVTGLLSHLMSPAPLDPSHYTQWGLDPLWNSRNAPAPYYPGPQLFSNAVNIGNNLSIDEQPGVQVSVAGHLPSYDEDRRLWYVDILLDGVEAYYPFVRMALVRYQPHSIQDAHLSRIVLADFIQLAPNRLAVVALNPKNANLLSISISGPAPKGTSNLVTVTLEQQLGSDQDSDPDLNWSAVPNAYAELHAQNTSTGSLWRNGEFQIPPIAQPMPPLRLVIREYELFPGTNAPQGLAGEIAIVVPPAQRRLVYAEVVDVLIPE
jgi:hypothetical protein